MHFLQVVGAGCCTRVGYWKHTKYYRYQQTAMLACIGIKYAYQPHQDVQIRAMSFLSQSYNKTKINLDNKILIRSTQKSCHQLSCRTDCSQYFIVMSNVTAVFKFKENKRQGISGDSNFMKYYHGNHIGMETLFQIDKNTFICRKRTN